MENQSQKPIRIELTDEQKATLRNLVGKEFESLEFTVEELEARINPGRLIN